MSKTCPNVYSISLQNWCQIFDAYSEMFFSPFFGCFAFMKKHYKQQHNAMYNGPFNVSDHNVIQCYFLRAGALVKWLWEETHVPKVVGSNPSTVYWIDIFDIYLL